MKPAVHLSAIIFLTFIISGCAAPSVSDGLTLGTVQASIHTGMSQAAVQAALGAPNIISRDDSGQEVWTYDRIYKQTESKTLIFWSASASRQKTLTVLITFDADARVLDYKYHSTEF